MRDTHLEKALDYLARDAREVVIDTLFCEMHNTWATLEGNRPEEDVEWLARNLFERHGQHSRVYWESESAALRDHWRNIAHVVIELLPLFCSRVAHRYDAVRQALEVTARVERAAKKAAREEALG